ncbi:hypothetical protein DdX_09428 [Ditylenchus destructor]|uniref:Uncharacterized protein n=1 Tax=Ditylenchus destructor TaxID=166010 RepID=A0AAD4N118_9BILA|nr:hypothetical protein DdX_09428 [Ditylenchus destructor]
MRTAKDTMISNAVDGESTHSEETSEIVTVHQVLQEKLRRTRGLRRGPPAATPRTTPQIQDFPEAINPGNRKSTRRNRYQSTWLTEWKRLTYHMPGSEPRGVIYDLTKSRIFRISGSHKSRKSQKYPAKPVPIDLAHRVEAIDVSHARIRAARRDL